jgi:RES domain-containing protein
MTVRPFDLNCDFIETIDFGDLKIPVAYLAQQCEGARSRAWATDFEWRRVDSEHDTDRGYYVRLTTRVQEIDGKTWLTCDWHRAIILAVMHHAWLLEPSRMDANSGDVWLQLAVFGEVRYG